VITRSYDRVRHPAPDPGLISHSTQSATFHVSCHAVLHQPLICECGYSGWNAATYIAEEVVRPERTLPAALQRLRYSRRITVRTEPHLHLLDALEAMKGEIAMVRYPLRICSDRAGRRFSALLRLYRVDGECHGVTYRPRVYYARRRTKAFFSAARLVDPTWHTPVFAILSQGLCAMTDDRSPVPELVIYIGMPDPLRCFSGTPRVFRRKRQGWAADARRGNSRSLIPASYICVGPA